MATCWNAPQGVEKLMHFECWIDTGVIIHWSVLTLIRIFLPCVGVSDAFSWCLREKKAKQKQSLLGRNLGGGGGGGKECPPPPPPQSSPARSNLYLFTEKLCWYTLWDRKLIICDAFPQFSNGESTSFQAQFRNHSTEEGRIYEVNCINTYDDNVTPYEFLFDQPDNMIAVRVNYEPGWWCIVIFYFATSNNFSSTDLLYVLYKIRSAFLTGKTFTFFIISNLHT